MEHKLSVFQEVDEDIHRSIQNGQNGYLFSAKPMILQKVQHFHNVLYTAQHLKNALNLCRSTYKLRKCKKIYIIFKNKNSV